GCDPTEPWRSAEYPYEALPHEPPIAAFAASLEAQGLHPFAMPTGVDRREGGACIRCRTCDGFPCQVDAKSDADVRAMRPALATSTVRLLTRAYAERLETSPDGRSVHTATLVPHAARLRVLLVRFVAACRAVNSPPLLLGS